MVSDLETALANVSSSNRDIKGKAQCDLAQMIWSKQLENAEIMKLLLSDDRHVRGAVSWAIADLNGPIEGVEWLMKIGVRDEYDGVRYWALRCASEMQEMRKLVSGEDIRALLEDDSELVRKIAATLWGKSLSRDTNPTKL